MGGSARSASRRFEGGGQEARKQQLGLESERTTRNLESHGKQRSAKSSRPQEHDQSVFGLLVRHAHADVQVAGSTSWAEPAVIRWDLRLPLARGSMRSMRGAAHSGTTGFCVYRGTDQKSRRRRKEGDGNQQALDTDHHRQRWDGSGRLDAVPQEFIPR